MSNAADIAASTQRFNDAVRAFTPPLPSRHAKLMPVRDGIVELRQKGASLRLIRELLATVGVAVGTDTIARFLAEDSGESPPQRARKRTNRRRAAVANLTQGQAAAVPVLPAAQPPASTPLHKLNTDRPIERPRTRGPRIADPRNL